MEAALNRGVLDPARSLFVTFSNFRSGNMPGTCSNSSSETIACPLDAAQHRLNRSASCLWASSKRKLTERKLSIEDKLQSST
ncbi:hypothetical protein pipiens_015505 [Culex pipiens pipiens]|uniref:Uncharacterized protein n=1 Tax=Culex pipiens pipiens TaxID=38569 RepID=A0ABD1CQP2_CULPP